MVSVHVLGIDAGGTKTVCLLADTEGHVIGEGRAGGANLQSAGELEVEKVLHHVMEDAIGDRDLRPAVVCIGIAGVDRDEDAAVVRAIMRRLGYRTQTVVVNDALVALVAGAGHGPGVVVVAGTGSIAYGRNAAGRAARAGGWGYLLGDEGGGFWIGRHALMAVVRQIDGRGPATSLTPLVVKELALDSPGDLVGAVYGPGVQRTVISRVAALVGRAAGEGDAVAADILARAAAELTTAATSAIRVLGMRGERFPIVLAGGVFRGVPALAADVAARLADVAPRAEVRPLEVEPALGGVRLAIAGARGELSLPGY